MQPEVLWYFLGHRKGPLTWNDLSKKKQNTKLYQIQYLIMITSSFDLGIFYSETFF